MTDHIIETKLYNFMHTHKMVNKGALCVALVVSRYARENGLPFSPNVMLTEKQGQVRGLSKGNVQAILKEYGITRILAEEGGRTSRGSIGNMQNYVKFLHDNNFTKDDLDIIEVWWVKQIRQFFAGKPFIFHLDIGKSIRTAIRDLMAQAVKRESEQPGNHIIGTVMQNLVGAKLSLILPNPPEMHGASVADAVSARDGDFTVEDVVIHVTSAPSEALIRKCGDNLGKGVHPMIITTYRGVIVAEQLAQNAGLENRIDVFDIEQFVASNLYEIGKFKKDERRNTAEKLITAYNHIIDSCETDPSLKISMD